MNNEWKSEIGHIEYTIQKLESGKYHISFFNLSAWEGVSSLYVERNDLIKLMTFIRKSLEESL
jgi:hypothetical protein